eukprot:TRINITY_DN36207_c0_g1_i1.p1 TRINITY_DN36207_c0_g1~~TRINITY_DN36207_c0_g1_i1.p1  ORF type:complete len:251 (+),score=30.26 TRINITY_DN36207_c0_g1_i1:70-753(+)
MATAPPAVPGRVAAWVSGCSAVLGAAYHFSGRHLFVPKHLGGAMSLCAVEDCLLRRCMPWLYVSAGRGPLQGAPRGYALVWLVNGVASTFVLLVLGMRVGKARKTHGVELPQMYAAGDSEAAVAFNSVQRGHQQALETYTSFALLSLIGGLTHPVTVTVAGVVWCVGRLRYATGYAAGGPKGRLSLPGARGVWWALLAVATAASAAALRQLSASPEGAEEERAHDTL